MASMDHGGINAGSPAKGEVREDGGLGLTQNMQGFSFFTKGVDMEFLVLAGFL